MSAPSMSAPSVLDVLNAEPNDDSSENRMFEQIIAGHRNAFPNNQLLLNPRTIDRPVAQTVRRAVNAVTRSLDVAGITVTDAYSHTGEDVRFDVTFSKSGNFYHEKHGLGRAHTNDEHVASLVQHLLLDQGVPSVVAIDGKTVLFQRPNLNALTNTDVIKLELDNVSDVERQKRTALIFDRYNVSLLDAVRYSFCPDGDREWITSPISPSTGMLFRHHGFSCEEALKWWNARMTSEAAAAWVTAGVPVEDAVRWSRVADAGSYIQARKILTEHQLDMLIEATESSAAFRIAFPHITEMVPADRPRRLPSLRRLFADYLRPEGSPVTDEDLHAALMWEAVIRSADLDAKNGWVNRAVVRDWATSGLTPLRAAQFIYVENVIRKLDGKKLAHIGPAGVRKIAAKHGTPWKRLRQYETDQHLRLSDAHETLRTLTVSSPLRRGR